MTQTLEDRARAILDPGFARWVPEITPDSPAYQITLETMMQALADGDAKRAMAQRYFPAREPLDLNDLGEGFTRIEDLAPEQKAEHDRRLKEFKAFVRGRS